VPANSTHLEYDANLVKWLRARVVIADKTSRPRLLFQVKSGFCYLLPRFRFLAFSLSAFPLRVHLWLNLPFRIFHHLRSASRQIFFTENSAGWRGIRGCWRGHMRRATHRSQKYFKTSARVRPEQSGNRKMKTAQRAQSGGEK
jgi:hypothetical protein